MLGISMNEVMPLAAAAADSVAISALWVNPELTEVDLVVDASRHEPLARAVVHLGLRGEGLYVPRGRFRFTSAKSTPTASMRSPEMSTSCILTAPSLTTRKLGGRGWRSWTGRVCRTDERCVGSAFGVTPKSASRKMFMLILDVPNSRRSSEGDGHLLDVEAVAFGAKLHFSSERVPDKLNGVEVDGFQGLSAVAYTNPAVLSRTPSPKRREVPRRTRRHSSRMSRFRGQLATPPPLTWREPTDTPAPPSSHASRRPQQVLRVVREIAIHLEDENSWLRAKARLNPAMYAVPSPSACLPVRASECARGAWFGFR